MLNDSIENISNLKTPYFLIHEDQLKNNVDEFKTALDNLWPNSIMAYSVKTNALPWVLQYMQAQHVLAEVVSDEEYQLALLSGYDYGQIVFNGPIKGKELFTKSIKHKAIVNVDSQIEVQWLCEPSFTEEDSIGLRVNIDLIDLCSDEIDYINEGFRFGFSYENGELKKTLEYLAKNSRVSCKGLHIHCNSITRSLKVYKMIARKVVDIIKEYGLELEYVDIGGGYFGGMPGKPTANDYISAIKQELSKAIDINKTRLIIEPGSALIGSPVDFVTTVIDVKDTKHARIVTTDGSRVNVDPLWKKKGYLYKIESDSIITKNEQIICGYTCMDHDRIMRIQNAPELKVGDRIIYLKAGNYSMTLESMFIRCHPDVYVKQENNISKVRERISIQEYYDIHTCKNKN